MSTFKHSGPIPQTPLPTLGPPFIPLPFLANLRDVSTSLITATTSPTLQSQILYRAADPSHVDLDGLSTLHNTLRIRTIFDLRSGPEIANSGGATDDWIDRISQFNSAHGGSGPPAVTRHWTPVFATESYNPEALALRFRNYGDEDPSRGFVKAYAAILEHGAVCFGRIIRHVARDGSAGTLIHCTAGKDRTGVLVAVILTLVGVDPDRIAEEYELTEVGLAARKPVMVGRLVATGAFGEDEVEAARAAGRMLGSKKESMLATLEFLGGKYGGAESYVKTRCGVSDQDIADLRRRFRLSDDKRAGGQSSL